MPDLDLNRDVVARVREATDVLEVVGEHVRLRHRGHKWEGLCPFHEEKTPSFSVDPAKGLYYCFGCHRGGDIITFVMELESLTFPEAVERLARRYGVSLPPRSPDARRRHREQERVRSLLQEAQDFFSEQLMTDAGVAARRELERRGFGSASWPEYGFGWAPDDWRRLLEHLTRRHPEGSVVEAGLAVSKEGSTAPYDRFRKRITFPIRSSDGRLVAFGGRILGDGEPKYLNSPESAVFQKRSTLFCLDRARRALATGGEALVVEGYFDCLSLHRVGIDHAVATLGTALTTDHARVLRRLLGEDGRVLLCYDADSAGRRAAAGAARVLLESGVDAAVVVLPAGTDPDDVVRDGGADAFRRELDAAVPLLDFLLADAPEAPAQRRQIGLQLAPLVCAAANPATRRTLIYELARLVDLPPRELEEYGSRQTRQPRAAPAAAPQAATSAGERMLGHILVRCGPQWHARIAASIDPELIQDERIRELLRVAATLEEGPEGGDLTRAVLDGAGGPALATLVAELCTADIPELTEASIRAQLRVLQQQQAREAARRLRPQIEEAERRGDEDEVARLQAEKVRLRQKTPDF